MSTIAHGHYRQRMLLACASREAEGYLELGMPSQALRVLQQRGKLVHANAHACYLLGETFREMSRYAEAIFPLQRSATLEPDDVDTWLALGWCFKRSGELQLATEALEAAIEHTPKSAVLHYNLACYYSLGNRRLDALRRLKRAFDLDPSLAHLANKEDDFITMRSDVGLRMLISAYS